MSSLESLSQSEDDNYDWCWSDTNHGREVQVHGDKHTLTFHPNGSTFSSAIRGTKILNKNMEHYFEVEMQAPFFGQARQVGVGTEHTALESNLHDFAPLLGKDQNSWGINYNGKKYHSGVEEKYVSIDADKYDTIKVGVHYDSYYGTLSFKLNGKTSGVAFDRIVTNLDLYPMLCSSSAKSVVKLTHCSSTVMSLKGLCRGVIRMNISDDADYEQLGLPSHVKAYLMYKSPRSRSTRRVERRDRSAVMSPSLIESTI